MNTDFIVSEIKTKRLLLQPVSLRYKKEIFKEFTQEITTHMVPQPAKHIREIEKFIAKSIKKMKKGEEMVFVVLKKESGEFVGCAGLHEVDTPYPELGVWVKKSAHGHKYGREAMAALKQWVDENLDYEYIRYPVVISNVASRKIPESLGGTVARELTTKNVRGGVMHEVEYRIYKK